MRRRFNAPLGIPFQNLIVGQVIRVNEQEIRDARKYWSRNHDFEYELVVIENGQTGLKVTANGGKRLHQPPK